MKSEKNFSRKFSLFCHKDAKAQRFTKIFNARFFQIPYNIKSEKELFIRLCETLRLCAFAADKSTPDTDFSAEFFFRYPITLSVNKQ